MVDILLSTMHGHYPEWVSRATMHGRAIVTDQCDSEGQDILDNGSLVLRTRERGLSRSRNMALAHSDAKYCMFCDNDIAVDFEALERLNTRLDSGALAAEAVVTSHAAHRFLNAEEDRPLGWRGISRVASWQIIVNRDFLTAHDIRMDNSFGLGTKVDHGEENILLADILRAGGRVILVTDQVVYHPDEGTGYIFGPDTLHKKSHIFQRMYGTFWLIPFLGFAVRNFKKILKSIKV